jgi:hypothetical protein
MASYYALRLFITAMHNRVGKKVESREITLRDGLVLVPIVAVILFLAIYPQVALHKTEDSVRGAVYHAQAAAQLHGAPLTASGCPPAYEQRFEEVACTAGFAHLTYEPEDPILVIK